MKQRKILYISGTRAEYGLMRKTLHTLRNHLFFKIEIAVTGMHLMPEFGFTIDEIKKDTFVIHEIEAIYRRNDKESMARFVGECVTKLVDKIKYIKPDFLLVMGDRAEMLAGALVGAYMNIATAHIHGGDKSSTIDEVARHAITKLAHIHFATTRTSAKRIINLGEERWRVFVVGSPSLDSFSKKSLISAENIARKYHIKRNEPLLLVLQHPVTQEAAEAPNQIKETLKAVAELGYQTIIIYPNADAGGHSMITVIEHYKKYPFIHIFKNIPYGEYASLMNIASALVGNSSSGIIEAPSFRLPFVNIGTRQNGRERAGNVIDAIGYNKNEIKRAIQKAIFDKQLQKKIKKSKNPYGNGKTAKKMVNILRKLPIDTKLLQKQITY